MAMTKIYFEQLWGCPAVHLPEEQQVGHCGLEQQVFLETVAQEENPTASTTAAKQETMGVKVFLIMPLTLHDQDGFSSSKRHSDGNPHLQIFYNLFTPA
jgi:hypothetical protein